MEDYYGILGISENASDSDIKHAFRRLAKQYHPDSRYAQENNAEAENNFFKINEAYETLSDHHKRSQYDRSRITDAGGTAQKSGHGVIKKAYNEGIKSYKKGRYEDAARHFMTAAEKDSKNALYCTWLGLSLLELKDKLHEAKKWCEQAVSLDPSNANYHINLALVYKEIGAESLFMKYINKALAIDPANKRAAIWLDKQDKEQDKPIINRIRSFLSLKKK